MDQNPKRMFLAPSSIHAANNLIRRADQEAVYCLYWRGLPSKVATNYSIVTVMVCIDRTCY